MLIGKTGEVQALQEQQAEAQRAAAAKENAERKRVQSLSNNALGREIRKVLNHASKTSGTGLKINNVDFGPVPVNGLDAAYALALLGILRQDRRIPLVFASGVGRGGGNDPYCLRRAWSPKYGRKRKGRATGVTEKV